MRKLDKTMLAMLGVMDNDPVAVIDRLVNWDEILGYCQRPVDVRKAILVENEQDGPYSWDLACKISAISQLREYFAREYSVEIVNLFGRWFNRNFSCIKETKLNGVKRPEPPRPKGFWERLFG